MWATVEMSEAAALRLAPRLATTLRRRVVVTTVDGPRCWVTLAAPAGEVVGPIDGRAGGSVAEFAATFGDSRLPWRRRAVGWPALLTGALGDQQRPALARHVAAAQVLGLPMPSAALDPGSATSARTEAGVALSAAESTSAQDGPEPQDAVELQRRYRRRRVARRTCTATGALTVAAGAVASIAWTDADLDRLAVFGAAMVVLILAWLVLRRVLL